MTRMFVFPAPEALRTDIQLQQLKDGISWMARLAVPVMFYTTSRSTLVWHSRHRRPTRRGR